MGKTVSRTKDLSTLFYGIVAARRSLLTSHTIQCRVLAVHRHNYANITPAPDSVSPGANPARASNIGGKVMMHPGITEK
jgi:hypothetical protein